MSTEKTPLISKLILIVLVLILGCLVILIGQQNSRRQAEQKSSPEAENRSGETTAEQTFERPRYAPLTNLPVVKTSGANPVRPGVGEANQPTPGESVGVPQTAPTSRLVALSSPTAGVPGGLLGSPAGGGVTAGANVSGRVWLAGTPPPEIPLPAEAACGSLQLKARTTRHYLVKEDGRLANVFVYVKEGLQSLSFPVSSEAPLLDNRDCLFEPYVMGLRVGQNFKVRNSDPILHSIRPAPRMNRSYPFVLQTAQEFVEPGFSVPEILAPIRCAVHPWMFAYISIVPHPFFAVTDAEGAFRLPPGLPPGKYLIAAVHLKAGESVQEVTVGEGEAKDLNFTLAVPAAR